MTDDVVTLRKTLMWCELRRAETQALWGSVTRGRIQFLIGSSVLKTADVETTNYYLGLCRILKMTW
jgi:hypothetical protein